MIPSQQELAEAIRRIQDALADDLEQGVEWMNRAESAEFNFKYPSLVKAISKAAELADAVEDYVDTDTRR